MHTEISLFSQKSFIQASEKFVCVRLGTYESLQNQAMIRSLLKGRMENTAFVVFAPDGKTKLTRSGRKPEHAFGNDVLAGMDKIAANYKEKNTGGKAVLSDFDSLKQSLNVAAADQRLLVYIAEKGDYKKSLLRSVQSVFNDDEVRGRFFYDTLNVEDVKLFRSLDGIGRKSGIFIIRPGKFGQTGEVVKELDRASQAEAIKSALLEANAEYVKTEKRKVYNEHVSEGKKAGVNFENNVEQGEDRDGDGKIDPKRERGQRRGR